MGATPNRWLLVLCVAGAVAAETPQPEPPPYRVEARLSLQPAEIRDQRFALRANIAPAILARGTGPGLVLEGRLLAKGGPLCLGPGSVFANGFEALP